jgi:pimeloyl-ACP methyl ester carboxylesterase
MARIPDQVWQAAYAIPNVGHVPHLQVPDLFNRELLKFLAQ